MHQILILFPLCEKTMKLVLHHLPRFCGACMEGDGVARPTPTSCRRSSIASSDINRPQRAAPAPATATAAPLFRPIVRRPATTPLDP